MAETIIKNAETAETEKLNLSAEQINCAEIKNGKKTALRLLKDFISAGAAGAFIGIGGVAYLSAQSKIAGALFFAIGLFAVCFFKLNLFTGKVCYSLENGKFYILRLFIMLLGNFAGAFTLAKLIGLTRLNSLTKSVTPIVEAKLSGGLFSAFLLGVLCNALIYLAVEGYSSGEGGVIKICALFLGVSVFVLCGFEHCVANAFYFALCGGLSGYSAWNMIVFLLINVLGNIVGGILTRILSLIAKK